MPTDIERPYCWRCGRDLPTGSYWRFEYNEPVGHRTRVCNDCIREHGLALCLACGDAYDPHGDADSELCPDCVSQGYSPCAACGEYCIPNDDGLCEYCADNENDDDWEDNPMPNWRYHYTDAEPEAAGMTDGCRCSAAAFLGFELETDNYSSRDDLNAAAHELKQSGVCFCKGDGSLSDLGLELVSHPRTLLSHKEFDWRAKFRIIRDHGGVSYNAGSSCGLHVHVNREFLLEDEWRAVDRFVNENEDRCMRFAQRRHSRWAQFDSQLNESSITEAKEGYYRYTAVNFCNSHTIEFRMFKGTLAYSRFMATLEWVDALVRWVKSPPSADVGLTWEGFCHYLSEHESRYAECIEYMRHRDIWIE